MLKTIALSLLLVISSACAKGEPVASHQTADEVHETPQASMAPVTASAGTDGVQEATIQVGSSYEPSSIVVKQGQPVRLKFHRADDKNCGGEVVFPALNLRKTLPAGETTIVELTPRQSGVLTFTCGMDMMKGKLVVQ